MRILGLSGSLRAASINSALLRAAARLAPAGMAIDVYRDLGQLPLFNPDLESQLPPAVARFHDGIRTADALLIASPEYAHGVTGTIKNALDWLVSYEPFVYKQVAVLNASPRAHLAYDALLETLFTMSAIIVPDASLSIPLLGSQWSEDGMLADREIAAAITRSLAALAAAVAERREST